MGYGQFIKRTAGGGFVVTNSLLFDGSTKYLSRNSTNNSTVWEFSAWIKRVSVGSNQVLFSYPDSGGTTDTYVGFNGTDKIWIYSNGNSTLSSSSFSSTTQWMHIFATRDLSGNLNVWVNRTLAATMSGTALSVPIGVTFYLGRRAFSSSMFFNGYMSEVFVLQQYPVPTYDLTTSAGGTYGVLPIAYTPPSSSGDTSYLNFKDNSSVTTSSNVGIGKTTGGDASAYWPTFNFVTSDVKTVVPP